MEVTCVLMVSLVNLPALTMDGGRRGGLRDVDLNLDEQSILSGRPLVTMVSS